MSTVLRAGWKIEILSEARFLFSYVVGPRFPILSDHSYLIGPRTCHAIYVQLSQERHAGCGPCLVTVTEVAAQQLR